MKTQHLNYCRHYLNWCDDHPHNEELSKVIRRSEKFMLPDYGVVNDDRSYKALQTADVIRLPFDFTCIEYKYDHAKVILVCIQAIDQIIVTPLMYRHEKWEKIVSIVIRTDHREIIQGTLGLYMTIYGVNHVPDDVSDSLRYLIYRPLLSLLNILACSNVTLEKSEPPKLKARTGIKGRRPFDTYHILTINAHKKNTYKSSGVTGSHNSPREHLRRGHIRQLEDKSIWVNACVVNPGHGPKIDKAYKVVA